MLSEPHPLDRTAREVCQACPVLQGGFELLPLGNHGGFSGARLWRVKTFVGEFCLKAYAEPHSKSLASFREMHRLMTLAREHGLQFVPRVFPVFVGDQTCQLVQDRCWELTTWMPGRADFHEFPTVARLRSAMEALAHLHRAWQANFRPSTPPAVDLRLKRLSAWGPNQVSDIECRLAQQADFLLLDWSRRALEQFKRWQSPARDRLKKVIACVLPSQFCLGDIWHDHVLFNEGRLTGLVDYGSFHVDNVATDLARLLGSFLGDDRERRAFALDAYSSFRPLSAEERRLVDVLDEAGIVVGAANWLRWLYLENRVFENTQGVIRRLSELVTRMENWRSRGIVQP